MLGWGGHGDVCWGRVVMVIHVWVVVIVVMVMCVLGVVMVMWVLGVGCSWLYVCGW